MAKLTIDGRTADLLLTMTSWEEMEDKVGRLDEIDSLLESRQRLRYIREIAAIMAAEGSRLGRGEEMPAEWLKDHVRPAQARLVSAAIRMAIVEGMRMETTQEAGADKVVDVTLAEIEKKEEKDG